MSVGTQAAFCATLVDEWVRAGVTDAVVCPGSRSTPLALALAGRPELALHVRLDERSAGFFAVGLAKATGRPAVLCVTSGTAAVELHPAVVEAHHGGVPLLVCTADRPPELQGVGAPQTIDQVGLYGGAVRWAADPGVPDEGGRSSWRSLGSRVVFESRESPLGPGPVHLNLAFREPLVETPGALPPGRPDGAPWHRPAEGDLSSADGALAAAWVGRRGVLVAGAGGGAPDDLVALAAALGWPLLADPRSGARLARPEVVGAADAILRPPAVRAALAPELVVVLGQPWLSHALSLYVSESAAGGAEVISVAPFGRWFDPDRLISEVHRADPARWLAGAVKALRAAGGWNDGRWVSRFARAEALAQLTIDRVLDEDEAARGNRLSEPLVARRLFALLGAETMMVVAASMPVRDLEWFAAPRESPPAVLANRGVNGIDGVSSSARGAAAAGGRPVVGLVGDLAFFHDVSALVEGAGEGRGHCTLVVLDNGGGGIFSFLPQAAALDGATFERFFATAQRPSVAAVAQGFGLPTAEVETADQLAGALDALVGRAPLAVVRVTLPDRAQNVALHARVEQAVADEVLAGLSD